MAEPEVAVVLPVYRNRASLTELATRLHAALDAAGHPDHQLVFVEDACPQRSIELLAELADDDPRLGALALEENHGQYPAVLIGVASCPAAHTVIMDADLQDPPEAVPLLLAALEAPTQVVFGGRRGRYQSLPRLLASKALIAASTRSSQGGGRRSMATSRRRPRRRLTSTRGKSRS